MSLAARMRHRINFEMQQESKDAQGRSSVQWVDAVIETGEVMTEVPAEVLTGPGREFLTSGQLQTQIDARITCRWFPGLMGSWRVVWDDVVYSILWWETDPTSRRELRIRCQLGVNDGG